MTTTWIWTQSRQARNVVAGVSLGGLVTAAFGPSLALSVGPAAAPAALAGGLVFGGWLGRGATGPSPWRLGLALAGGALAGGLTLLGGAVPAGLAHALLGLGVGLALAPEGFRGGLLRSLWRALPSAVGALAGGVTAGALVGVVGGLSPVAAHLALAGCVALGVGLAELIRHVVVFHEEAPAWIDEQLREAGDATRPVLRSACDAYRRVVTGVREAQAGFDVWDQRESLDLAFRLLEKTARECGEADRLTRERVGLEPDAALAQHPELLAARANLLAAVEERQAAALERAGKQSAALARLAATVHDRSAPSATGADLEGERLARRADTLQRLQVLEKSA